MKSYLNIITFLIVCLFISSCKTDKNNANMPCDANNPIESITWLGNLQHSLEMMANPTGSQILRYKYNGQYVFWVEDCHNCPDGMVNVYSCSGDVVCQFGGIAGLNTCPNFYSTASDSTMLWRNF